MTIFMTKKSYLQEETMMKTVCSPRNLPWQLAIADVIADVHSYCVGKIIAEAFSLALCRGKILEIRKGGCLDSYVYTILFHTHTTLHTHTNSHPHTLTHTLPPPPHTHTHTQHTHTHNTHTHTTHTQHTHTHTLFIVFLVERFKTFTGYLIIGSSS